LKGEMVLVRHGESEWSREGRYAGRADVSLTPHGREEAEAVGRQLAGRTFARVLASPLERARDSCRLAGFGADVELRPELMEWDYGTFEGRTGAEMAQEAGSLWTDGAPAGETVEMVGARADRILGEIDRAGDVAIFAHRDVLRVLAARWLQLPAVAGRMFSLATASISVLGYEGETPVVMSWNQIGHLDRHARE
jgi:probable phosphoglycerate mutase